MIPRYRLMYECTEYTQYQCLACYGEFALGWGPINFCPACGQKIEFLETKPSRKHRAIRPTFYWVIEERRVYSPEYKQPSKWILTRRLHGSTRETVLRDIRELRAETEEEESFFGGLPMAYRTEFRTRLVRANRHSVPTL